MRIEVNGSARSIEATGLVDLLKLVGVDAEARGIAVALNGEVLPRKSWPDTRLHEGDRVEIVGAVQGG